MQNTVKHLKRIGIETMAKELKKISLKFCENTQIIDIEDISRLILLNKPLVVFGSLYFASDVRELLKTINRQ